MSAETTARPPAPGATTGKERKITPDLARGFMLLLIAMAYSGMYLPHDDVGGYGSAPGGGGLDQAYSFLATLFLENRAFPTFGILFGCGMVMLFTRQRRAGVSDTRMRRLLRRRALWLLAFGLVHAFLVFPGEILAAYGLGSLVIGWLLFRPDKALRKAAAILAVGYTVTVMLSSLVMVADGADDGADEWGLPGYTTALDWIERFVAAPFAPVFNMVFFPLLILVVIGIWVGRKGLLDEPEQHQGTLRRMAAVGIAVSVLGALPLALSGTPALDLGTAAVGVLTGVQVLTGVLGGLGYVALFALIGMRLQRSPGVVAQALAAAGKRSLSVYLFASVGVAVVLHVDLAGVGEHVHRAGAAAVAVAVWLVGVLLARWLESAGRPGPADALLRKLIYRGLDKS